MDVHDSARYAGLGIATSGGCYLSWFFLVENKVIFFLSESRQEDTLVGLTQHNQGMVI